MAKLIAQQEQSGQSVRAFCKQHRTSEHSFYQWRKRLAEQLPMKFALVETNRAAPTAVAAVEVILASGERLRIAPGINVGHAAAGAECIARAAMIHLPASVRVYLATVAVRYAAELRRAARAGERGACSSMPSPGIFLSSPTAVVTGSKFCIGIATDSRCGLSVWRKERTRCRSGKNKKIAARSPHRSWGRCCRESI